MRFIIWLLDLFLPLRFRLEVKPAGAPNWSPRPWQDDACAKTEAAAKGEARRQNAASLVYASKCVMADGSPGRPADIRVVAFRPGFPKSEKVAWSTETA